MARRLPWARVGRVAVCIQTASGTHGGVLSTRLDHDEIEVDVRGAAHGEGDDLGDVVRAQRGQPSVDAIRPLLVAAETHYGELGLHHARGDLDEPHRLPEVLTAQRA